MSTPHTCSPNVLANPDNGTYAGEAALRMDGMPSAARATLWRTLQTFSITRIVIAVVLLAYLSVNTAKYLGVTVTFANWETCIVYLFLAVGFALLSVYWQKQFMLHLMVQLVVDIIAISLLYVAAGGARSGLAILYLFPLAGSAILAPLILALFFVSVVTLIMLAESGFQLLSSGADVSVSGAGLYGAAFFTAIYVVNRLAEKLLRQEELAVRRGQELQLAEAINRLVIADMGDGILVVGRDTEVYAGNPALERMLGLSAPAGSARYKLTDLPSLAPIAEAFKAWMARPHTDAPKDAVWSTFVRVKPGNDIAVTQGTNVVRDIRRDIMAHLKLSFATVETSGLSEERTVIFLQDVTEIENRAQQLKLASMGRLTASIAHEVRNPLSAISHAASLLAEDITHPSEVRLLNIIGDNVIRLNRMIEDILKLSRKAHAHNEPLRLAPFLTELLTEFRECHAVSPGLISLIGTEDHQVWFDPLHLREVVVNLLTNALRYASGRDGSIRIHVPSPLDGRLELHVQDDGPPISQETRSHLFEPFYTTSSKGTGLGLYLARELCLNNGAMLDYEYRVDLPGLDSDLASGRFVITFATHHSL
ncbi:MAG TPA: ATP-binding protein [Noviherbaspirillum sp.]|nr:ATP-binding protein [Noviherbaspirillum sp.]